LKLEIRTLRSEYFEIRPKHWWSQKDRKAARLSLKVLESQREEVFKETSKRLARELFFGESYVRKDWKA
jgi:hypothetical protein